MSGPLVVKGQSPDRRPSRVKLTDHRAILADNFDRQSVNFDNPEKVSNKSVSIYTGVFILFWSSRIIIQIWRVLGVLPK